MGAAQSKDGSKRSTFARLLDPHGLVLEKAGGWESSALEETARAKHEFHATHPLPSQSVVLNIPVQPDEEKQSLLFFEEQQEQEERRMETSKPQSPPASIVEEGLRRVAPPGLVRWLADKPEKDVSGEQLFEHQRSSRSRQNQGFVSALCRPMQSNAESSFAAGAGRKLVHEPRV